MRPVVGLALLVFFGPTAARSEESFEYRVARRINQSLACHVTRGTVTECEYEFEGIKLSLVLDPGNPDDNAFVVRSAPRGRNTWLKFGGRHRCAIISHHGNTAGEMALVFISPRDGDIYSEWNVPACKF